MCLTMAAGCWNRRELNDLAISVAIGVDKRGNQILLTDQIVDPGAVAGKEGGGATFRAPVSLFQEKGRGIQEAARRMTIESTRKIYVGQLQMLVIGEKLAKEGIGKLLDHISRDHEYRSDFYVIIARRAEAQDILKVFTALEKTPATKMRASLEVSSKAWGTSAAVKFDEFISNVVSKGKEAAVTGIRLIGDPKIGNDKANVEKILSPANLHYSGVAVFKKDKMLGWLNEDDSKGYNYTQGKIKSTVELVSCPKNKNKITVEILRNKKTMKAVMEDGKPVIHIRIKTEGVITDAQCRMDFTKPSSITLVERLTSSHIQNSVLSAVNTMQNKYKSDIFGFGEAVERKYPQYWEKVKIDWDKVFPTIRVNIRVESNIQKMFKTTKSLYERMEG
ncbi:Ger(x)C family spore germination protein [Cohnella luojiensis]|uniref:Ger(X)C family spore germination protein n=1 Tax=Cohnella luojiensis TaxID=652876 RepID=A0A4Y8LW86_9BACL|nr:Ger(x)C family spore germination protein [Cohnella luojiensis]